MLKKKKIFHRIHFLRKQYLLTRYSTHSVEVGLILLPSSITFPLLTFPDLGLSLMFYLRIVLVKGTM